MIGSWKLFNYPKKKSWKLFRSSLKRLETIKFPLWKRIIWFGRGMCRGPLWLKFTSICWKEFLHMKSPAKCYGTSISLLKLVFLPRMCGGVRFLPQLSRRTGFSFS